MMIRNELLQKIWQLQDDAYDLMYEYDSMPHYYGENILYQAEADVVKLIGQNPGITSTELSNIQKKTPSACSQIIQKLIKKGLVEQNRNMQNRRIYNLQLTQAGEKMYQAHTEFNQYCQDITFQSLCDFSEKELEAHLRIQEKLNACYQKDIERSKERFGNL